MFDEDDCAPAAPHSEFCEFWATWADAEAEPAADEEVADAALPLFES